MKTILVIEDNIGITKMLERQFLRTSIPAKLMIVNNTSDGRNAFDQHKDDIIFIAMDGNLEDGGDIVQTTALVKYFRSKAYNGVILAMSGDVRCQELLQKAGCDRKIKKGDVIHEAELICEK
ncbi:MAG: hypothetical protein Q8R26_03970 [bacterium]|nr:hypothetical protein [bacterium]